MFDNQLATLAFHDFLDVTVGSSQVNEIPNVNMYCEKIIEAFQKHTGCSLACLAKETITSVSIFIWSMNTEICDVTLAGQDS